MNLSKRLQAVAAQVHSGGVVADIGCDHGFTIIRLVQDGCASGGIAMDINEGPLERARQHIQECGLDQVIDVRLSDGTQALQEGEAQTILISGIGGGLMERILMERKEVTTSAEELVLSPQSEIYKVRKALHALGFCIEQEEMVKDMGKFYTILRSVPGQEQYDDPIDYLYGRRLIEQRSADFVEYIRKEKRRVEGVLANMPHDLPARETLQKEHTQILEVMDRMQIAYNEETNARKRLGEPS